jgi:hypothetical protein
MVLSPNVPQRLRRCRIPGRLGDRKPHKNRWIVLCVHLPSSRAQAANLPQPSSRSDLHTLAAFCSQSRFALQPLAATSIPVSPLCTCYLTASPHLRVPGAYSSLPRNAYLPGPRYIVAQIFGGYIACLLVYTQYRNTLVQIQAETPPAILAEILFTPNGPAGIFGMYLMPGSKIGQVFVNEFVCVRIVIPPFCESAEFWYLQDFFLAMVIFGAVDPTNVFIPPVAAPFIIAMA